MEIRSATRADLPAIVKLLADDPLGAVREHYADPLPGAYGAAFEAMARQGDNELPVAVADGTVVGCLQLVLIPGIARLGAKRAQIEGVRVARDRRGERIGETLIRHAIAQARRANCALVQLTTDKSRADAHRFYERLGFVASHEGMKLDLTKRS